jgi:mannose-6-phosphate isomerase
MDPLTNPVRSYAWGSLTAIPELLGVPASGEPQAELWMGAHPGAPSTVRRQGLALPLTEVIAADPDAELGADALARFGPRLPFLFKVLAAELPLSLQVHPDPAQAAAGFADENARGIPVDAPHRNYRDSSHKPELICALSPFEALCGFREPGESAKLLEALDVAGLRPYADLLRDAPAEEGLRQAFGAILTMADAGRSDLVASVGAAGRRLAEDGGPDAGVGAAVAELAARFPADPGVVAALLLQHRRLAPGEALYLDAGCPHAYLRGVGVEVMANSDNVLRCGLTSKHVDVPELLRVLRFEAAPVPVCRPAEQPNGEELYRTPAPEFRLTRCRLAPDAPLVVETEGPQILLCVEGEVAASHPGEPETRLRRGASAYVSASAPLVRLAASGGVPATVFRATTGS